MHKPIEKRQHTSQIIESRKHSDGNKHKKQPVLKIHFRLIVHLLSAPFQSVSSEEAAVSRKMPGYHIFTNLQNLSSYSHYKPYLNEIANDMLNNSRRNYKQTVNVINN